MQKDQVETIFCKVNMTSVKRRFRYYFRAYSIIGNVTKINL